MPVGPTMLPDMMEQALSMCGEGAEIRPVPDYPGYHVSCRGDAFSTFRGVLKKLNPSLTDRGTLQVRGFRIHRAVCVAFNGKPPKHKNCAIHRNGDVLDNRAENLFWGGLSDRRQGPVQFGSKSPNAKVKEDDIKAMHRLHGEGTSQVEIARRYGLRPDTIQAIISGRSWRHVYHEVHGDKAYKSQVHKLTKADAREIHRLHQAGLPRREIALKYRMAPCNVYNVISGRTWREVFLEMHPKSK